MTDIALITDNLNAFADAIGTPLTDWQADALRLEQRITAIVAPRQSGKSRSLAVLALWWAFRHREQKVLVVSAGEEASRRLLSAIRAIVSASPILRDSAVDEQAGLLTLVNGSEIRSVPASERQVRGWSVDLLLVDEAALVPDDLLLGAAFPTTAARPDAKIVLASSATSATGAFYDHAVRGEAGSEHVRTFRWQLAYATWISPSVISAARDSMTEMRFNAEYMGVFASGQDALLTRQAIESVLCDRTLWSLDALQGPARVIGGCDWGGTNDRSTLVALGRVPGDESVFSVVCAHRWLAGYPGPDVVKEIAASPALFALLVSEVNGLGLPLSQLLARAIQARSPQAGGGRGGGLRLIDAHTQWASPQRRTTGKYRPPERARPRQFVTTQRLHTTTAASKAAMFGALRILIEKRQIVLPRSAEELIRELQLLRVDLNPSGTEKIEAGTGHDDLAMGLALSLGPHRLDSGEWRTHVARLSEQKPPSPWEAYNPDDPGVYQSIAGPELSGLTLPVPTAKPINVEKCGPFTITR
jgi:Helicase